jgi:hypothetical protein
VIGSKVWRVIDPGSFGGRQVARDPGPQLFGLDERQLMAVTTLTEFRAVERSSTQTRQAEFAHHTGSRRPARTIRDERIAEREGERAEPIRVTALSVLQSDTEPPVRDGYARPSIRRTPAITTDIPWGAKTQVRRKIRRRFGPGAGCPARDCRSAGSSLYIGPISAGAQAVVPKSRSAL